MALVLKLRGTQEKRSPEDESSAAFKKSQQSKNLIVLAGTVEQGGRITSLGSTDFYQLSS